MPDVKQDEKPEGEMPTGEVQPTMAEVLAELQRTREALKSANKDAESHRRKLKTFEEAEEAKRTAEMSELEKTQTALKKAEERATQIEKAANAKLERASFIAAAAQHGIKNPADAYALAKADGVAIEIDDDGNVKGIGDVVKAMVEAGRLPTISGGRPTAPGLDGGPASPTRPEKAIVLDEAQKFMAQMAGMSEQQYIDYLKRTDDADKARQQPDLGQPRPG